MSEDSVAFINVIDVEPERSEELVALLKEGAEQAINDRPGFMSLELLISKDRTRVVNIARWSSAQDAKAAQQDPMAAAFAKKAAEIASPNPGIYPGHL